VAAPPALEEAEATSRARRTSRPSRPGAGELVRAVVIVALVAFVLLALPSMLSTYWITVFTAVAIYAVVALGLNLLMGRVGLVSLGQIAVLGLGAWVAAKLLFDTALPFPAVILLSGLITMVLGTIVGLPALRLSGLYLALITLMMAGAITVVLAATDFPNGGPGFLAHSESSLVAPAVRGPQGYHSGDGREDRPLLGDQQLREVPRSHRSCRCLHDRPEPQAQPKQRVAGICCPRHELNN
jgi:hypothetical protein